MKKDKHFINYLQDINESFAGWDFSYISETGRINSEMLSWSYGSIVKPLIVNADSLLDMGTGGGEFLSKLQPFSKNICATEAYEPNIPLAKKKLGPLGVKIFPIQDDETLPFEDRQFDLIINKHEAYSPLEIRRIITDDGVFVTQQVGGLNDSGINDCLDAPKNEEFINWKLKTAVDELTQHGFDITFYKEEFPVQRFYDVGALVYYLKAIPWQIPDFTIEKYEEKLFNLHQHIQSNGYFDVNQHRFIIVAKPK